MDHRFLLLPVAALVVAAPACATTYLSPDQARELMFPGATFTQADVTLAADQVKAVESASGVSMVSPTLHVWHGPAGELFIVDQVLGKHEFITYAVGIDGAGAVKDVEILQYNESYGDQIRNAAWRAQFMGKTYGAPLKFDSDIKNISGATLSCKHITEGVKRLLAAYALVLRNHAG